MRALLLIATVVLLASHPLAQPTSASAFDNYDIYLTLPGASAPVQVTSIPNRAEFNPAWAPFGPYLVHDAAEFGPGDVFLGQSLWVTNASAGTSAALPGTDGGNDADWWPYGALIAYDRTGALPISDPTIYLSAAWGGARYALRSDAIDPSWSPPGRYLAFQQPSDGSIRAIDVFTGNEKVVAASGQNPAWSPNGRHIAFSDGDDIYRIRVRSNGSPLGSAVAVTAGPAMDAQPSWSRFGEQLAYHSDATGGIDIWSVASSGGTGAFLAGDPTFGDFDPAVYPWASGIVAYSGYTSPTVATKSNAEELEFDYSLTSATMLFAEADAELLAFAESVGLDNTAGRNVDAWIAATFGATEGPTMMESGAPSFDVAAYPNPASATMTVRLQLDEATETTITALDVLGREIARLSDGPIEAGRHTILWDVTSVPPGVYMIRVRAGAKQMLRQVSVVR